HGGSRRGRMGGHGLPDPCRGTDALSGCGMAEVSPRGALPSSSRPMVSRAHVRHALVLAALMTLAGCASLAVNRCDTIPDRDGKSFSRFFLGVATLGLSEVTIQQEEVRQAYEGSPGCPPPSGVRVVSASQPAAAGGQSVALGTLVNGAPWAIVLYLNQDPD